MTDIVEADTPEAAEQILDDNTGPMSFEEAQAKVEAKRNARQGVTPEAEAEEPTEEEVVEEPEEPEAETPEEAEDETEEGEDDVLSQFDVEKLTDDQKAALAQELGSGAGKTIGKQRKQIRELEEKLKMEQEAKEEAIRLAPASDNPFAAIRKAEDVDKAIEQVELNVKTWNDRVRWDQTENLDGDKGVEVDGKFYTLSDLKPWLASEEAKLKPLRDRKSEIKKLSEAFEDEDEKIATAKLNLGIEEGTEASDKYEKYIADPKFQLLKSLIPDLAVDLIDIFGHAAIAQTTEKPKVAPKKRNAPKAKSGSGVPRIGSSSTSMQGQLSSLEKIAMDATKDTQTRKAAAVKIRQLKSHLKRT